MIYVAAKVVSDVTTLRKYFVATVKQATEVASVFVTVFAVQFNDLDHICWYVL